MICLMAYFSSTYIQGRGQSFGHFCSPTEAADASDPSPSPRGVAPSMLLGMSACGRKALTLLSSVFAVCGLGLLGISVSTDYWLYLEEGIVQPQNQTAEIKLSLHAGLWRVCFLAGMASCPKTSPAGAAFAACHGEGLGEAGFEEVCACFTSKIRHSPCKCCSHPMAGWSSRMDESAVHCMQALG